MGKVFRVSDKTRGKGREMALKLLTGPAKMRELFRREFDLLAKMEHPNIVRVYELFEDEKECFYTMEYLDGQPLKKWISGHQQLVRDFDYQLTALELLLQLAGALRRVHDLGVIHHDVHPNNIQIIADANLLGTSRLKLLDFGISLNKEDQRKAEIKTGSKNYRSPEHARGARLDFAADIYCFGAVAYELLTGQQPFSLKGIEVNENAPIGAYAAMAMHALRKVPKIKSLDKRLTLRVNRMVQVCMEKEPEHRYSGMEAVEQLIEDILAESKMT